MIMIIGSQEYDVEEISYESVVGFCGCGDVEKKGCFWLGKAGYEAFFVFYGNET